MSNDHDIWRRILDVPFGSSSRGLGDELVEGRPSSGEHGEGVSELVRCGSGHDLGFDGTKDLLGLREKSARTRFLGEQQGQDDLDGQKSAGKLYLKFVNRVRRIIRHLLCLYGVKHRENRCIADDPLEQALLYVPNIGWHRWHPIHGWCPEPCGKGG